MSSIDFRYQNAPRVNFVREVFMTFCGVSPQNEESYGPLLLEVGTSSPDAIILH